MIKLKKNKNELDFVVEKSVKQGESITANAKAIFTNAGEITTNPEAITTNAGEITTNTEEITKVKNAFLKQETQLARTKNTVDNLSVSEVTTTKRVDDLAEVILKYENKYKAIEEELKKVRLEVFLFEHYNSRQLHVAITYAILYIIEDRQLRQVVEVPVFINYLEYGLKRLQIIKVLLKKKEGVDLKSNKMGII